MRALIQRVTSAEVSVQDKIVGEIGQGILAYIGIGHNDDIQTARKLIDKIMTYRIFENTEEADKVGKLDWNVQQAGGSVLLVSQFTLMANTTKGRRPNFTDAMPPTEAKVLFEQLLVYANSYYDDVHKSKVATGEFGATMLVTAHNDGPLNFILEV